MNEYGKSVTYFNILIQNLGSMKNLFTSRLLFCVIGYLGVSVALHMLWRNSLKQNQSHDTVHYKTQISCTLNNERLCFNESLFKRRLSNLTVNKQSVFAKCRNFSQRSKLLGRLLRDYNSGNLYFSTLKESLQDIHLIMRYAPRADNEGGIYLSVTTSYLIFKNLRRLSKEQQKRTSITIFLSKQFNQSMFTKLSNWLMYLYKPYTKSTTILVSPVGNQKSWEFAMDYVRYNSQINLQTIVFQIESDYICEPNMLQDTIEFFASHNPCFIHPSDYPDRYTMTGNDDDGYLTIVAGRTRIWRSITSSTVTYAARLETLIAFFEVLFQPVNDWVNSQLIRSQGGNAAIFSAFPSHCAHIENRIHTNERQRLSPTAPFYGDWRKMASEAFLESQSQPFYPLKI